MSNKVVLLRQRPTDIPGDQNFSLTEAPMPVPQRDEVLLETLYVSVDPYVRVAIDDRTTTVFGAAQPLETPLMGRSIARVVESGSGAFREGDYVLSSCGWQKYAVAGPDQLQKVDPDAAPLSWWLGVLGTTGFAAYVGTTRIARPASGQTYVVTSAAGATGSIAGQIAVQRGARVVGIAGSAAKCAYVENELGFDACISHHSDTLVSDLRAQCPAGIDHSFENVGGRPLEAVMENINPGGIIALCGVVGSYNDGNRSSGPNLWPLIRVAASIRGFRLPDHQDIRAQFVRDMLDWIAQGRITHQEDVMEGMESAGQAYRKLMMSQNFGKIVVRV